MKRIITMVICNSSRRRRRPKIGHQNRFKSTIRHFPRQSHKHLLVQDQRHRRAVKPQ
jgi:hypothetical protein